MKYSDAARAAHKNASTNLRRARKASGRTQAQLAYEAKMAPSTVYCAERGDAAMETKVHLAAVLGFPLEKLFKKAG